ncbi:hypothetical protein NDA16_001901 [Ustilago loliicola]|nr:hypothetical protein NDA16_001901 [Ustilago loliicola]
MSSLSVTHAFEDGRFIQSTFTSDSGLTTILPKGFVDDIVNDIALSDYSDATEAERYQIFRDAHRLCLKANTFFDDCPFEILLDESDEDSVDPSFKDFDHDAFPPVNFEDVEGPYVHAMPEYGQSGDEKKKVLYEALSAFARVSYVCAQPILLGLDDVHSCHFKADAPPQPIEQAGLPAGLLEFLPRIDPNFQGRAPVMQIQAFGPGYQTPKYSVQVQGSTWQDMGTSRAVYNMVFLLDPSVTMISWTFIDGHFAEAVFVARTGEKMPMPCLDPSRRPIWPPTWRLAPAFGQRLPEVHAAIMAGCPVTPTLRGYVNDRPKESELSELYRAALNAAAEMSSCTLIDIKIKVAERDIRGVHLAYRTATVESIPIINASNKQKGKVFSAVIMAFIKLSCVCKSAVIVEFQQQDVSDEHLQLEVEIGSLPYTL